MSEINTTTNNLQVTVTENEEKNGVEIKFSAKPSEAIRDSLKLHGFRWSRYQGLWWAKRRPETIQFAYQLIYK